MQSHDELALLPSLPGWERATGLFDCSQDRQVEAQGSTSAGGPSHIRHGNQATDDIDVVFSQYDYLDALPPYEWSPANNKVLNQGTGGASYPLLPDLDSGYFDFTATYVNFQQVDGLSAIDAALWKNPDSIDSTDATCNAAPFNVEQYEQPRFEPLPEPWLTSCEERTKSNTGSANNTPSSSEYSATCTDRFPGSSGRSHGTTPDTKAPMHFERPHPTQSTLQTVAGPPDDPISNTRPPSYFPCDFRYHKHRCNSVFTNVKDLR